MHLPKTGGTSMNRLFREGTWLEPVVVDADDTALKHDSVALREQRSNWRAGARRRFITIRRLSSWLLSDWQHKRRHMLLPNLDFEPVRSGLFYSLRLGGVWVAADWWLHYFNVHDGVTALRLEHLQDDLNTYLLPLLGNGTPPFNDPPRTNTKPNGPQLELSAHLSSDDLKRIAHCNPRWQALETKIYGSAER